MTAAQLDFNRICLRDGVSAKLKSNTPETDRKTSKKRIGLFSPQCRAVEPGEGVLEVLSRSGGVTTRGASISTSQVSVVHARARETDCFIIRQGCSGYYAQHFGEKLKHLAPRIGLIYGQCQPPWAAMPGDVDVSDIDMPVVAVLCAKNAADRFLWNLLGSFERGPRHRDCRSRIR